MTRLLSDAKNLLEAHEIRKSGYKTKIHISPHKTEIDEWILVRRWSSRVIVNELRRLYPNENHPSDRAIDNYRKKYLPVEMAKTGPITAYSGELRDSLLKQFEPAKDGLKIWALVCKMLAAADKLIDKTGVVPKFVIDLVKVVGEVYKILCEEWARLGLVKTVPTELSITENKQYESTESVKARIGRILSLNTEIDAVREKLKEFSRESARGLGETASTGGMPEGHVPDDGKNPEVQERPAPEGVVQDTGQQGVQEGGHSGPEGTQ